MNISIGTFKMRLEIVLLIVIVFWILLGNTLCSCCTLNVKQLFDLMSNMLNTLRGKTNEGFTNVNTSNGAYGPQFSKNNGPAWIMDPSKWASPTLLYTPGQPPSAGVKSIWDRPKQPIPLPEGEMNMFATTEFKPECCPNTYSSSTGCACMNVDQLKYLQERGSNNVPFSEY